MEGEIGGNGFDVSQSTKLTHDSLMSIINALKDIPQESALIQEAEQFVGSLKMNLVPELQQGNKANKATVGTYFSVRDPKNAMRSFGVFIYRPRRLQAS